MKNILFIMLFAFMLNAKAQTVLEQTYSSAGYFASTNSQQQLYVVDLELAGNKYLFVDRINKILKLYDLNHLLWKSISFNNTTDLNSNYNGMYILYLSQHLFDTDDEIEFLYVDSNNPLSVTQIVNEDGSILFTATNQGPFVYTSAPQVQLPIYNTSSGTKLVLSGTNGDANAYVYSLTGTLTTEIAGNSMFELNALRTSVAYPNPSSGSTKIDYSLPNGISTGEIVFYDVQGKEIKRFVVDNTFNSINISTEELNAGVYYYNLQTTQGTSDGKKLITVK